MLPKSLKEFAVTRIAPDQVLGIRLKQILQRKATLSLRQVLRRLRGNHQERVLRRARNVIFNLHHQRRNEIEVLMNVGEFIQQLHHAVIVFERVQAHPRQAIFACDQIFIKRLVLMPKKDDTQGRHGWRSQDSMWLSKTFRIEGQPFFASSNSSHTDIVRERSEVL